MVRTKSPSLISMKLQAVKWLSKSSVRDGVSPSFLEISWILPLKFFVSKSDKIAKYSQFEIILANFNSWRVILGGGFENLNVFSEKLFFLKSMLLIKRSLFFPYIWSLSQIFVHLIKGIPLLFFKIADKVEGWISKSLAKARSE